MIILGCLGIGLSALILSFYLWGAWRALRWPKTYSSPNARLEETDQDLPGISILKPIKGIDVQLRENLESFFKIQYPHYEILFCISNAQDPAAEIVRQLMLEYPQVDAQLFMGRVSGLANPKVDNLMQGYHQSRYDLLLISDSNIRAESDTLKRMVTCMRDDRVGLVTSSVSGHLASGFFGKLEAFNLNTFYTRWILLANELGHPTVMGKAMLFRRSLLERMGGLKTLGAFLAEDYVAGKMIHKLGYKIVVSSNSARQILGHYDFKKYWMRHLRWSTIRKNQTPLAFYFEPLTSPIPASAILSLSIYALNSFTWIWVFSYLAVVCAIDLLIDRKCRGQINFIGPILWMVREIFYLIQWIQVIGTETVEWRNQKIRIGPESLIYSGMGLGLPE